MEQTITAQIVHLERTYILGKKIKKVKRMKKQTDELIDLIITELKSNRWNHIATWDMDEDIYFHKTEESLLYKHFYKLLNIDNDQFFYIYYERGCLKVNFGLGPIFPKQFSNIQYEDAYISSIDSTVLSIPIPLSEDIQTIERNIKKQSDYYYCDASDFRRLFTYSNQKLKIIEPDTYTYDAENDTVVLHFYNLVNDKKGHRYLYNPHDEVVNIVLATDIGERTVFDKVKINNFTKYCKMPVENFEKENQAITYQIGNNIYAWVIRASKDESDPQKTWYPILYENTKEIKESN